MTQDEIIYTLEHTAAQIKATTQNLTEGQLRQRGADGHWSIKELTGHLRDDAEKYGAHFRRIASEDNPLLPGYDQDLAVAEGNYQGGEIGSVIGELDSMDRQIATLFRNLSAADWQRVGTHEERGPTTLAAIAEFYADHELEHLAEIEQRAREVFSSESL